MTKIGLLHTGIRNEEKLLLQAANTQGVELNMIDIRSVKLTPSNVSEWDSYDVFLERSISSVRGNAVISFLSDLNLPVINTQSVMEICNDKFRTACILEAHNVPVVRSILVFNEETAKEATKELGGFPVVTKSREGSWGRLMALVNDADALESVFSHRAFMGPEQSAVIIQEYINKKESRDIRAFVIDGRCICAIYRTSPHWITNTARGGVTSNCLVNDELQAICKAASDAVGGGILAMDIFETDSGYVINEINHTMEFKNSEDPTGVSISGEIISYCRNYNA
ncbi:RimK family alpha-L-glutamate ligase [Candidatus Dojkabacteria bacterium]|uniref:RimK family alpha-L-glutamate ligase n=1 Tax=Candidatus Dojkabacteria bacterium TaxID=2099670 RepID=A0A955L7M2_9BACT|nr:RimK family alpha-L-glutamate ligase [Candidatus Dojkabacteria bacterium]